MICQARSLCSDLDFWGIIVAVLAGLLLVGTVFSRYSSALGCSGPTGFEGCCIFV